VRRAASILIVAATLALPASVFADADPASDVLLSQNVFLPYPPNVPAKPLQTALTEVVARAKRAGYEIKVALIAAPTDLGAVPDLFSDPQKYADLLTQEISFNEKPRVLVVLPGGLGGNNLGDNAATALGSAQVPANAGADDLARTAITAVGKLASADGHPVAVPAVPKSSGGTGGAGGGTSGPPALVLFGVPVALIALGAGLAAWRGRQQRP
jgi:hypothetical protein